MNLNNITFDTGYFHHVCIYTLYGMMVVLAFIVVERLVYYGLLSSRANRLGAVIHGSQAARAEQTFKRRDLITRSIVDYMQALRTSGVGRVQLEDLSAALFISVNGKVGARLWILDTIVTAAPLIGLLGTILGIMDTFRALSAGGISDPAAVSRGIGDALLATAIGIGTALFGLLGHNLLHRIADYITEDYKRLLLLTESFTSLHPDKLSLKSNNSLKGTWLGAQVRQVSQ